MVLVAESRESTRSFFQAVVADLDDDVRDEAATIPSPTLAALLEYLFTAVR